jgi:hypothetical protein
VKVGKTAFDVNLNGNNLLDKSYIAHLSRLKTMAFQILKKRGSGSQFVDVVLLKATEFKYTNKCSNRLSMFCFIRHKLNFYLDFVPYLFKSIVLYLV